MAVPFPPPPPPHPAQGENPIISMWYCLASGTWTTAITCAYLVGVSHRLGHMGWIDRVLFSIAATVLCDGSEKQSTYFDSMLNSIRTHFTSLWSRTEKVGRLFWILPWCLGKIAKKLQFNWFIFDNSLDMVTLTQLEYVYGYLHTGLDRESCENSVCDSTNQTHQMIST